MIQTLWVKQFRNLKEVVLDVQDHLFIFGQNNQGKTNFLEAIYFLQSAKLFRPLIQNEEALVGGKLAGHNVYVGLQADQTKYIELNQKRLNRFSQLPFSWNVTYINADILRIFQESPDYRRQVLDQFISEIDPEFKTNLILYSKLLKQKNALLKSQTDVTKTLMVYHPTMAKAAEKIIETRTRYLHLLIEKMSVLFKEMGLDILSTISVEYFIKGKKSPEPYSDWLLAQWAQSFEKEKILGYTLYGPHLDDYFFDISKRPLITQYSRGINRAFALVLKLSKMLIIDKKEAVVLLDDPFVELDDQNKEKMIRLFQKYVKCVYTCVTPTDFDLMSGPTKMIEMKNGQIHVFN